jgi:hypothetical protein
MPVRDISTKSARDHALNLASWCREILLLAQRYVGGASSPLGSFEDRIAADYLHALGSALPVATQHIEEVVETLGRAVPGRTAVSCLGVSGTCACEVALTLARRVLQLTHQTKTEVLLKGEQLVAKSREWALANGVDLRHLSIATDSPEDIDIKGSWPAIAHALHRALGGELLRETDRLRAEIKGECLAARPTPQKRSPAGPTPRLIIKKRSVSLDGKPVPLDMTAEAREVTLCYLGHLIRAGGEWISGPDINRAENDRGRNSLAGQRWDRVRASLPSPFQKLIQTDRRKGYRLSPAAWHR